MYKLRNGGKNVIIDQENKLKGYCLNPDHPSGGNKARVFSSALGLGPEDYCYLEDQIRLGLSDSKISFKQSDQWGRKYDAVVRIKGKNGNMAEVVTGWIFDYRDSKPYNDQGMPRLATAYVKT